MSIEYLISATKKIFNRNVSFLLRCTFFFAWILFSSIPAYSGKPFIQTIPADSLKYINQDSIANLSNYNSEYMLNTEIEHQKLIRNIFAGSFILILAFLLFTMFFYGSKIKKISSIIILQDEALKSTKDQLIKIIGIFNYIDQQVYITDSKGYVEWINTFASTYFKDKYEVNKISLIEKFSTENQVNISKAVSEQNLVEFNDELFANTKKWKMIPVKNSKGEFSNMVYIC
jgi:hypothetical protein